MAFQKANYIIMWETSPQVYSTRTIEAVFSSKIPEAIKEGDKMIVLFSSYFPDTQEYKVFRLSDEDLEKKRQEWIESEAEKERKKAEKANGSEA